MFELIKSYISKWAESWTPKTMNKFPFSSVSNSASGVSVNDSSALGISSVFAAVNCISQDVAKIPLHIYKKTDNGKERIDINLSYLLNQRSNQDISAIDFRQAITACALLFGNGVAEIQYNTDRSIYALNILNPLNVKKIKENGIVYYEIKSNSGQVFTLWDNEVLHIKGLSLDGFMGINPYVYGANAFGSAIAADTFSGKFFKNGITTSGYLKHPANLSAEAQKRLVASVESRHLSLDNQFRVMILEEGMDFVKSVCTPEEAQMLETRQYSAIEICRYFRIPPHKIADLSRATFSNIEQQSIDYVGDTLGAWFKKWEQELNYKCLTQKEKEEGLFIEHKIEGLLRGDIASRYSAYSIGRQWGWLSANDIRDYENLNHIEGGDTYLVPLNMVPAEKTNMNLKSFAKDIASKIARAELTELEKHISHYKDTEKFNKWFDSFYIKHSEYVLKTLSVINKDIDVNDFMLKEEIKKKENKEQYLNSIKETWIYILESKINELF